MYFDNSATTRVSEQAAAAALRAMREDYGNPSSIHGKGVAAFHALSEARASLARLLHVAADELYFTSCGTESNNIVLHGAARLAGKQGKILISAVEHPSVHETAKRLAGLGYQLELIPVSAEGVFDPDALEPLLDEQTILVSIMHVNNETGAIQPLRQAGQLIRRLSPRALFHVDAVQSFGRLPLPLADWQADAVTMSGHKIHAPKGIGLLWLRAGVNLPSLMQGGGQERGLRSGTENMSGIMAFVAAAEECYSRMELHGEAIAQVRDVFLSELRRGLPQLLLNGPADEHAVSHILNISLPGVRSEVLLHSLEMKGLYVSAGSACTSRSTRGSRILQAMGLPKERVDAAIRCSFSRYNTPEEAVQAAGLIVETVNELSGLINLGKRKGRK
ncbi:MAG: cysteine desulfurase [Clostridia bacterium]|nr:cysteine desulfurase [Clostridia bacterium]